MSLNKTTLHKKAFMEALEASLGIVTTACKAIGVSRSAYYKWCAKDPQFKEDAESIQDVALDFAESSLFKQIKKGVPASTIFYLKTKGKKRGYIERTETHLTEFKEQPLFDVPTDDSDR